MRRKFWGRGLATAAAREALRYGFETLKLREIVSFTVLANERSRRVMDRLGFTLLLALRFLPLVQEEFQNLLRSVATRSVNLRRLGLNGALALLLGLGERLLANVLLRAEQGAESLLARGGHWIAPQLLLRAGVLQRRLQWIAGLALMLLLGLRWRYGAW